MDNNQDDSSKPVTVKLDGFAAPAGTGASGALAAAPSLPAGAVATSSTAAAAIGGGGGGGAGTDSIPAPKKSPPSAAAPQTKPKKKRGPGKKNASAASSADNSTDDDWKSSIITAHSKIGADFEVTSLPQIRLRLCMILKFNKLPKELPKTIPDYDVRRTAAENVEMYAPIKAFAAKLQVAIEEYNLLLSLVSAATYKWGVDRSGASQQNLSVMSAELQTAQEVISNVVSARLSNVLCPAVDILIGEVEIVREGKSDGGAGGVDEESTASVPAKKRKLNEDRLGTTKSTINERRINHYTRPLVDPSYVHLCHCILSRNAPLLRHTVATSIATAMRVIGDYLQAMKKDSSHDTGKGGYY